MPRRLATASAVVRLSPVSMTTRMPSAASALSASGVVALTGSAMAMTPASLPSTARKIAVAPSWRRRSASCGERRGIDVEFGEEFRAAEREPLALDHADDAFAGRRIEAAHRRQFDLALGRGRDDRRGQRMLAAALDAGRKAQHLRLVEAGQRRRPPRPSACLRSACRSCRPPACRSFPCARAPRRS